MCEYLISIPYNVPLASEELSRYPIYLRGDRTVFFKMQDDESRISYADREYFPRIRPIYLQEKLKRCGQPLPVPPGGLFRSPGTGGKWMLTSKLRMPELRVPGEHIDIITFSEDGASISWLRLVGTDDPYAEDPADNTFTYQKENGRVSITGVSRYCERIHIPAMLDGCPVTEVRLPSYLCSDYVREIVIAEGVERVAIDLNGMFLKTIQIPTSAQVAGPPVGIQCTAWFADQPDGPVFFHGYYCGEKGKGPSMVMMIDSPGAPS